MHRDKVRVGVLVSFREREVFSSLKGSIDHSLDRK